MVPQQQPTPEGQSAWKRVLILLGILPDKPHWPKRLRVLVVPAKAAARALGLTHDPLTPVSRKCPVRAPRGDALGGEDDWIRRRWTLLRPRIDRAELRVVLADEFRPLGLTLQPSLLEDRGHVGVGHETLVALLVLVEHHPHASGVRGVAKDLRTLRPVLLSLLRALGREGVPEAVEILDLRRRQDHLSPSLGRWRDSEQQGEDIAPLF